MKDGVTTDSGIPVAPVYGPPDARSGDGTDPGRPGAWPFTRGVYPTMYRGRLWTMRQYAGFGTAEETNRRYHYLLDRGQTGLSVAFDLPTQMGFDSDHPMSAGEVGRVGVAIDALDDLRTLFRGIRLEKVSTSMTINATAAVLLALYVALADEEGVPRERLSGTVQNDILKEYVARGTYIYPVDPSLRLVSDVIAFCAEQVPRWNTVSISGYHIREAGATAPQEVAFTFANGLEYVERARVAGLAVDEFAPRLSFFFAAHNDFLEEVAKFRAARRLWARLMRERYDASDASCRLRFHTQTGGSTLTAQQPRNNVARVTLQAMAAVLGGTQSLHANGYDEALALPTEESARIALRTQQILAHESGVTRTADPLGGSWYVEALTDEIEERARAYLDRIADQGGAARAISFMQDEIHRSAYRVQLEVESGERTVVGVNAFREEDEDVRIGQPDYPALEEAQRERLVALRTGRDGGAVRALLARIREAATSDDNLVPPMIGAVKAGATLGEISDALREVWGTYDS
ncbi:MAG TPA: methylmalonyl-CoA mutase family protein [Longimicrobiales bacterium]|nr:methylmalonyl-CoA mutase family protein [Longimicrobiales bacterium]